MTGEAPIAAARRRVRAARGLTGNRKAVLLYLIAPRADGRGPVADKIAEDCGLSVRTVRTFLADYRASGFVRRGVVGYLCDPGVIVSALTGTAA